VITFNNAQNHAIGRDCEDLFIAEFELDREIEASYFFEWLDENGEEIESCHV